MKLHRKYDRRSEQSAKERIMMAVQYFPLLSAVFAPLSTLLDIPGLSQFPKYSISALFLNMLCSGALVHSVWRPTTRYPQLYHPQRLLVGFQRVSA